uniref:Endonuclease V n=1 Tax=Eptatretus burgeri TaxID=7764 RepID=A0A8C4QTL2_EPTBU
MNEKQEEAETEELQRWTREQLELKAKVVQSDAERWQQEPGFIGLERVAGADISFSKKNEGEACISLVVLEFPTLQVVYESCEMVFMTASYVPGFLAFREVNPIATALTALCKSRPQLAPQVIFVDGNGVLHPRGFGLACHLGVLVDLPCIGVAKDLLCVDGLEKNDNHRAKVKMLKTAGDSFPLVGISGKTLGTALLGCSGCSNPVYISSVTAYRWTRQPDSPLHASVTECQNPFGRLTFVHESFFVSGSKVG